MSLFPNNIIFHWSHGSIPSENKEEVMKKKKEMEAKKKNSKKRGKH